VRSVPGPSRHAVQAQLGQPGGDRDQAVHPRRPGGDRVGLVEAAGGQHLVPEARQRVARRQPGVGQPACRASDSRRSSS
jgi:hypothetical protein